MVVVDADGRVYAKNRRLDTLLEKKQGISIREGCLYSSNREDNAMLAELIQEVSESSEEEKLSRAMRLSGSSPVSLLLLPLLHSDIMMNSARVIIFVASQVNDVNIVADTLMDMYGLTQAESRLAISLVTGATLDETSKQFHLSRHTLRTQLKSIYVKTDCRRQAELVVKILTSPAILAVQQTEVSLPDLIMEEDIFHVQGRLTQSVFLRDGRRLSYAEYGPEDGAPMIMMHTLTGSRLQLPEDESSLLEHGIRILAPERPGIGLSDSKEKHSILNWSEDIVEFADCLELKRFGVMGNSVGSCFALATAHQLPERVESVTLISPISEFYHLDELNGIIPVFKMLLGLGKYLPAVTLPIMRLVMRGVLKNPQKYYAHVLEQMPPADFQIFNHPDFREKYLPTALEAVRNGERWMTTEQLMVAREWGFMLKEIKQPVTIWHGSEDRHNPLYMAESLLAEIPQAKLNVIPAGGHFLIYSHWPQIIESLVQTA